MRLRSSEYLIYLNVVTCFGNGVASQLGKKKNKVSPAWEDWNTSSTVWNFSVGREARRGVHGLEYEEKKRYQKSDRYIYKKRKAFAGKLAPQLVETLILKYSDEGDKILDPFVGTGTTLVEAIKHNRKGVGIDINPGLIDLTERKLAQASLGSRLTVKDFQLVSGDAEKKLKHFGENEFDFILAHPPYWDLIEFSGIEGDLSGIPLQEYLRKMDKIIELFFRILKPNKFCVIVVGDRRRSGIVPIGFYIANIGIMRGFNLWDTIINNTRFGGKQYGIYQQLKSKRFKFHLLDHDYVLVFQKRKSGWKYVHPATLETISRKRLE